jgi:histidinol-phosphatase
VTADAGTVVPAPGPYAGDLALALALADEADELTVRRFRAADLVVETKPDLTPVSDADRAVEELLRDRLRVARADDRVVGEEQGGDRPDGHWTGRRWVLDPIDGTKSFVRGVPVWATLVALVDGTEAVVGVVSAPALGRRWWAARGAGAWTAWVGDRSEDGPRPLRVSAVRSVGDASLSYSDRQEWPDAGAGFDRLVAACWRTRGYGDFWSHVLVAEGAVDIAAEPELSVWDVAALVPVVVEAGGQVTGCDGGPVLLGASGAVSTNGLVHDDVLALLSPGRA